MHWIFKLYRIINLSIAVLSCVPAALCAMGFAQEIEICTSSAGLVPVGLLKAGGYIVSRESDNKNSICSVLATARFQVSAFVRIRVADATITLGLLQKLYLADEKRWVSNAYGVGYY